MAAVPLAVLDDHIMGAVLPAPAGPAVNGRTTVTVSRPEWALRQLTIPNACKRSSKLVLIGTCSRKRRNLLLSDFSTRRVVCLQEAAAGMGSQQLEATWQQNYRLVTPKVTALAQTLWLYKVGSGAILQVASSDRIGSEAFPFSTAQSQSHETAAPKLDQRVGL